MIGSVFFWVYYFCKIFVKSSTSQLTEAMSKLHLVNLANYGGHQNKSLFKYTLTPDRQN